MSLIPRISVHSHVPEYPEKLVQGFRRQHQDRLSWNSPLLTLFIQMHMVTEAVPGEDKELEVRCSRAADNSSQVPQLQGKAKFKHTPLRAQGQPQLRLLQHLNRAHVTHPISDKPPSQSLPAVLTWPPRGICVLLSTLGLVILS